MATLQLIGSLTSPYVRKIRILLAEKNLPYEFILDDVWSAQPNVLAFNPLGQVPAIILPTGEVLTDSRSISDYIEAAHPSTPNESATLPERLQVLKWQALCEGIIDAAVKCRVEQIRPEALQWRDWFVRQEQKIDRSFALLDAHLATHTWLANERYGIADITLQCALNFVDFRMGHIQWRENFVHLARFEAELSKQAHYADTLPRVS